MTSNLPRPPSILRFAPRTRGAMIGLMSWLGYASMMLFFL
jgi:hypothetical protein